MNQLIVDNIYKSYKKDVKSVLFPNGKKELIEIVSGIGDVIGIADEKLNSVVVKDLVDIYVDTFIKKSARQEDLDIIEEMINKHSSYIKTIDCASKVMAFIVLHVENSKDDINEVSQMYIDSFEFIKQNEDIQNKYLKDKEYGLVKQKPIYTHGQVGTENYFSILKADDNSELIYEYVDTHEVDGINGFVDEYKMSYEDGKLYSTLYINRYGKSNSNNAPKGFKLKKVDIDSALDKQSEFIRKDLNKSSKKELIITIIVAIIVGVVLFISKRK